MTGQTRYQPPTTNHRAVSQVRCQEGVQSVGEVRDVFWAIGPIQTAAGEEPGCGWARSSPLGGSPGLGEGSTEGFADWLECVVPDLVAGDRHRPEQEEQTDHGHYEPDQSKEQLPDRISRSRLDHRKVRFLWINPNRDRESTATLPPMFRNRELPLVLRLAPQPLPCDKEPGASITRGGGERPTAQNFGVHRDTTPPHPHLLYPQSDPDRRARKPSKKEHQSKEQTDQKNQHLEYIGQTRLLDENPGEADAWLFWGELCD